MSLQHENNVLSEKKLDDSPPPEPASFADHARGRQFSVDPEDRAIVAADQNLLHRDLKSRHMQMIAM